MAITYEQDVVAWANEQANMLRTGQFDRLDIAHIAEEIEDVGKSEQRELATRMAVLLAHLLKWQFQPERRGASWEITINTQRKAIARRLRKTPSLKQDLQDAEWWEDVWGDASADAARETRLGMDYFPAICPWSTTDILNPNWRPE
ncbi:MAG: DUF29 domain-containing protein [Methylobacter sp.]|nr:DUF29 domain-containing protein [Methylobacter sp.]